MKLPELELVSFDLCPFVQRSVITLLKKKVPHKITFIDVHHNPPQWFQDISPMGKVPLLKVNQTAVLFESAVINEYIDEITSPTPADRFLSQDALTRAVERAWIEWGSSMNVELYDYHTATTETEARNALKEVFVSLEQAEKTLAAAPYFRGSRFTLVDTAWAPFFMRASLHAPTWNDSRWKQLPKVRAWGERLLEDPEVKASVIPTFASKYASAFREMNSWVFA